jgi:hypothetical protein
MSNPSDDEIIEGDDDARSLGGDSDVTVAPDDDLSYKHSALSMFDFGDESLSILGKEKWLDVYLEFADLYQRSLKVWRSKDMLQCDAGGKILAVYSLCYEDKSLKVSIIGRPSTGRETRPVIDVGQNVGKLRSLAANPDMDTCAYPEIVQLLDSSGTIRTLHKNGRWSQLPSLQCIVQHAWGVAVDAAGYVFVFRNSQESPYKMDFSRHVILAVTDLVCVQRRGADGGPEHWRFMIIMKSRATLVVTVVYRQDQPSWHILHPLHGVSNCTGISRVNSREWSIEDACAGKVRISNFELKSSSATSSI